MKGGKTDFHEECSRKIFDQTNVPQMSYDENKI